MLVALSNDAFDKHLDLIVIRTEQHWSVPKQGSRALLDASQQFVFVALDDLLKSLSLVVLV